MLLNEFNQNLNDLLLKFLWKQWIQLGVQASYQPQERDGWIIDPEALWLLTATVGREDARLFDIAMEWLVENAAFINIPRLKSILRQYNFQSGHVLAAMAAAIQTQNKRLKWRFPEYENSETKEGLFNRDLSENTEPETSRMDPVFLKHGFIRGPVQFRSLARRFNYTLPECALLRLRALVGLNARAEIYAYLCTHPNGHPSGIARETGYSQKNIQDTITDMSAAHIVFSTQRMGRKKMYFINKTDWRTLLHNPESPPQWITWPPLFRALELIWMRCREMEKTEQSPLFLSGQLRELADELVPLLEREENAIRLQPHALCSGTDYIPVFFENVLSIFSTSNPRPRSQNQSLILSG